MAAPAESLLYPVDEDRGRARFSRTRPAREVMLPQMNGPNGRELEYCLVRDGGGWQQVRFRNDPRIWLWPGVYEHLVRDLLRGNAPAVLRRILEQEIGARGESQRSLRVLHLGAGNGWFGEELRAMGVDTVFGVDPCAEAARCAARDRRGVFEDYLVMDMRRLSESQREQFMHLDFNCLACVEPLSSQEPSPNAFVEAFNLLAPSGWVTYHVHERSLDSESPSRFVRLTERMTRCGAIEILTTERYRHRFTTNGQPAFHSAFVARKLRDFDPTDI
jgi:hypothetical protein